MRARFITADVFTNRMFGGNQLAVFPEAGNIPPDLFQSIAREFNYSETTFVFPPDSPAYDAKVRIFAPGAEMPFAGHPLSARPTCWRLSAPFLQGELRQAKRYSKNQQGQLK